MSRITTPLITLALAAAFATAHAQDGAPSAPALSKQEAQDLKTGSTATYKARKEVADANHELNKGDCEIGADGGAERACKKAAKAQAKTDKAQAKAVHEAEKDAIKAHSK